MQRKKSSAEQEFLDSICKKVEDETISARLRYLFDWYEAKAVQNRKNYNLFRTLTYLLPCLITLTSVYIFIFQDHWGSTVSATISVALAFINHRIDHYRYYENMVRYRNTAEKLKRETELYLNHCLPYSGIDEEKNRRLFAFNIEYYASVELASWENLQAESYRSGQNRRPDPQTERPDGQSAVVREAVQEQQAEPPVR